MIWKKKNQRKIFISYRRADTQGFAGRLEDSLEAYFGENRVFRDIQDIKGGSDFAKDIKTQLGSADAVIVLIGPNWLSIANADGKARLEATDDWVSQEIITAIEKGTQLFPVLIEGTVLPRKNELPEKLAPLLNYNAITISDRNWDADVLGLGKIISFDIPTTNERILRLVQIFIYFALGASLIFSAGIIALNSVNNHLPLILLKEAGAPFYAIVACTILTPFIINLVAKERQKFIIYSVATGVLGSAFFFFGVNFIVDEKEAMFVFFGSVLVTTLIFTFLSLSGFKPK